MDDSFDVPEGKQIRCGRVYEAHVDQDVEQMLLKLTGRNIFGEPNYRILWGYQRLDENGYPITHPAERERFHLVKWVPPELIFEKAGGRWDEERLGPFPSHGEYGSVFTFQAPNDNGYVRPTVDMVQEAFSRNRRSAERTLEQINEGITREIEKTQRDTEQYQDDMLEDAFCGFAGKTWMPVSGPQTATSRRSFG